jgi:streptomycin 6-kinase
MQWLDRLPDLVAGCARRWSLAVEPPFTQLSHSYVAPATHADGTPVVLKATAPGPEVEAEIAALRAFDGRGSVRLLEADPERGVLLLERLRPGTPLSVVDDDEEATAVAAEVMQQLWRPLPAGHPYPHVAEWAAGLAGLRRRFAGTTGPLPRRLVEEAEALFTDLIASMVEPVLLHGDLHHDNILAAERPPWLAIDPKGVVGEPAYEVGALLRNLAPRWRAEAQPGRVLARRVDQLAGELGFDRERIRGWGFAQAVLAAWWSLEDGEDWEWAIYCAELLS